MGGQNQLVGVHNLAVASCTIPSNWADVACTDVSSCDCTSATKTLTVPSGNSGVLKFSTANVAVTMQYSKNGGAFTTVANNGTVTFANNDTIALKHVGLSPQDDVTITVKDNTTSVNVGTFRGQNTHV